jgi:hypothetical protein
VLPVFVKPEQPHGINCFALLKLLPLALTNYGRKIRMKNLLAEVFKNGIAFFFPKKYDRGVDWKTVGQLRTRLSGMHLEIKEPLTASTSKERNMSTAFNVMTRRVTERQGHARWYGQDDDASNEKALHKKIEDGQRSVMALKQSGQFPAILPEEADALREVHQRFMKPTTAADEARVASFLSGDSDDINELLFSNLSIPGTDTSFSARYLNCSPDDTVQDIPVITDEMIAALEHSAILNSIGDSPEEVESIADVSHQSIELAESYERSESKGRRKRDKRKGRNKKKVACISGARKSSEVVACVGESNTANDDLVESLSASNVTLFRPRFRSPS